MRKPTLEQLDRLNEIVGWIMMGIVILAGIIVIGIVTTGKFPVVTFEPVEIRSPIRVNPSLRKKVDNATSLEDALAKFKDYADQKVAEWSK